MPFINSVRGTLGPQGRLIHKTNRELTSTGGIITTAGTYRIHTFSTVGNSTFTPGVNGVVEYLILAGGGGGGAAGGTDGSGGGGAGGLLSGSVNVIAGTNYTITVGNGAASYSG